MLPDRRGFRWAWVRLQEYWSGIPDHKSQGRGNAQSDGTLSSGQITFIEPRSVLASEPHDLTFDAIEGDFQVSEELFFALLK